MAKTILIGEDDPNISELVQMYLEKEGYNTRIASDGGQGLDLFRQLRPDLVLLDIMLPVMDGWSVLRTIRQDSKTPVIMLTAKGETNDKVQGLKQGADDYLTKPFDKLIIDLDSFELIVDGKRIETPPKEMELLFHLASSPNRVFTRNQLLDEVWGFDYFGDSRTVDVHVKRLREKLEGVSDKWSLKTVWGVGYKFEVL